MLNYRATSTSLLALMDRDEMSNLFRGRAIDTSYQVSVHLAKCFQRRRFLEIDQPEKRIAYRSVQNVQSLLRVFHRCFLPSFGSSDEMIQM